MKNIFLFLLVFLWNVENFNIKMNENCGKSDGILFRMLHSNFKSKHFIKLLALLMDSALPVAEWDKCEKLSLENGASNAVFCVMVTFNEIVMEIFESFSTNNACDAVNRSLSSWAWSELLRVASIFKSLT